MRLTPFGKLLRKHRIDRGLLLADMAGALSMSPAFLSSIETGRKQIPAGFVERCCQWLELDAVQRLEVQAAAEASAKSVTLKPERPEQSMFVMALQRRFDELSDDQFRHLRQLMENKKS